MSALYVDLEDILRRTLVQLAEVYGEDRDVDSVSALYVDLEDILRRTLVQLAEVYGEDRDVDSVSALYVDLEDILRRTLVQLTEVYGERLLRYAVGQCRILRMSKFGPEHDAMGTEE